MCTWETRQLRRSNCQAADTPLARCRELVAQLNDKAGTASKAPAASTAELPSVAATTLLQNAPSSQQPTGKLTSSQPHLKGGQRGNSAQTGHLLLNNLQDLAQWPEHEVLYLSGKELSTADSPHAEGRSFKLSCSVQGGCLRVRAVDRLQFVGAATTLTDVRIVCEPHSAGGVASQACVEVTGNADLRQVHLEACGLCVKSSRAELLNCTVNGANCCDVGIHIADPGPGRGADDLVTLSNCEVKDTIVGLLVSHCRTAVLQDGKCGPSPANNALACLCCLPLTCVMSSTNGHDPLPRAGSIKAPSTISSCSAVALAVVVSPPQAPSFQVLCDVARTWNLLAA